MFGTRCERCGKDPAEGLAAIGDDRYCHGNERPSCYEVASWQEASTSAVLAGLDAM